MRIAVGLLLLTRTAFADPSDMREPAMGNEEIRLLRADELGFTYRVDVVAAGLAKTDGGAANRGIDGAGTATAHVAITTNGTCELVGVGGLATARSGDNSLSASQWASVCLAWDDMNGHTSIDHRLDWDLTPRLLATPRFRPGAQRHETIGWDFVGSTVRIREDHPSDEYTEWLQAGLVRAQTTVGWAIGDPHDDVDIVFGIASFREYIRKYNDGPPLTLGVAGVELQVMTITGDDDDPTVAGLAGTLAHLEGLRVGGLRLGAKVGGWLGAMTRGYDEMHRNEFAPVAEGNVSVERTLLDGLVVRLSGERQHYPRWDARLAIDNRATASLQLDRGALKASLQATAGITELRAIHERSFARTGGVTAEASYRLTPYVDVRARSELGKSLYAPNAMDEPQWASESMLMLAAHTK